MLSLKLWQLKVADAHSYGAQECDATGDDKNYKSPLQKNYFAIAHTVTGMVLNHSPALQPVHLFYSWHFAPVWAV